MMKRTRIISPVVSTSTPARSWSRRAACVAQPGTLPTEGARVPDATGLVVSPGGVEPHTHLAHAIMSHPDEPRVTLGPEEDTRGMAPGGPTPHLAFCYRR